MKRKEKTLNEISEKRVQKVVLNGGRTIDVSEPAELSKADLWLAYNSLMFKGERG